MASKSSKRNTSSGKGGTADAAREGSPDASSSRPVAEGPDYKKRVSDARSGNAGGHPPMGMPKLIDLIPNDEQRRLVQRAEYLNSLNARDFMTEAVVHAVPVYVFHVILEWLVHFQYMEDKDILLVFKESLLPKLPPIFVIVYIINRFSNLPHVQWAMFVAGTLLGVLLCNLMLLAKSPTLVEYSRVPGNAVTWMYIIWKSNIGFMSVSLICCAVYGVVMRAIE